MSQETSNFPTEVAVAIAEIRTKMTSIDNHIKENKDNHQLIMNKLEINKAYTVEEVSEVREKIQALADKVNDNNTATNLKFAFVAGIWAAIQSYFNLFKSSGGS